MGAETPTGWTALATVGMASVFFLALLRRHVRLVRERDGRATARARTPLSRGFYSRNMARAYDNVLAVCDDLTFGDPDLLRQSFSHDAFSTRWALPRVALVDGGIVPSETSDRLALTVERPILYSFFRWTLLRWWLAVAGMAAVASTFARSLLYRLRRGSSSTPVSPADASAPETVTAASEAHVFALYLVRRRRSAAATRLGDRWMPLPGYSAALEHLLRAVNKSEPVCGGDAALALAVAVLRAAAYLDVVGVPQPPLEQAATLRFASFLARLGSALPVEQFHVTARLPAPSDTTAQPIILALTWGSLVHRAAAAAKAAGLLQPMQRAQPDAPRRALHLRMEQQRRENNAAAARVIAEALVEQSPPLPVREAILDPVIGLANAFRRAMQRRPLGKTPAFERVRRATAAAKLGVSDAALAREPDFYEFATRNFLHRYLFIYSHELREGADGISIMVDGRFQPWAIARDSIRRVERDSAVMAGRYSDRGLVNESIVEWRKLEPFIRVRPAGETNAASPIAPSLVSVASSPALVSRPPHLAAIIASRKEEWLLTPAQARPTPQKPLEGDSPSEQPFSDSPVHTHDWGDRYLLEICSWIVDEPRLSGDHAWLRLKTRRGEIYSVGQYRPGKRTMRDHLWLPMQIKVSQFQSPDVSEFWNGPYAVIRFEVSEEHFNAMKTRIERDQESQQHVYQLFHGNCVNYAKSVAALAGIRLPSQVPIFTLLLRQRRLLRSGTALYERLPVWARNLLVRAWALYFNVISLFFGAGRVDPALAASHPGAVEAYLRTWRDLSNPEKVVLDHPFVLGEYVRKEVEMWRAEQLSGLEAQRRGAVSPEECIALDAEIERTLYAVPPQFRCEPSSSE